MKVDGLLSPAVRGAQEGSGLANQPSACRLSMLIRRNVRRGALSGRSLPTISRLNRHVLVFYGENLTSYRCLTKALTGSHRNAWVKIRANHRESHDTSRPMVLLCHVLDDVVLSECVRRPRNPAWRWTRKISRFLILSAGTSLSATPPDGTRPVHDCFPASSSPRHSDVS